MLHVAFVRSVHAHARLDAASRRPRALAAAGVVAVVTGDDPSVAGHSLRARSALPTYVETEQPMLAWPKVRFAGEAVAAVVAADRYAGGGRAPRSSTSTTSRCPRSWMSPTRAGPRPSSTTRRPTTCCCRAGSSTATWRRAGVVGRRGRARVPHEPADGGAARGPRRGGGLERRPRASSRSTPAPRSRTSRATRWPRSSACPRTACGSSRPTSAAASASRRSSIPRTSCSACSRCAWTGPSSGWRRGARGSWPRHTPATITTRCAPASTPPGGLTAMDVRADCNAGAYSVYPWTAGIEALMAGGLLPGPYKLDHYRCEVAAVATNTTPAGPYRGVARPATTFVMERVLDLGARALGLDPVEIRRVNLVGPGDLPYTAADAAGARQPELSGVLREGVEAIGYGAFRAEQARLRAEGRYVGIGFASYNELTGLGQAASAGPRMPFRTGHEGATVRMDPSGAVTVLAGVTSQGQGIETTVAQIVASELGVAFDAVTVVLGDTDATPFGLGAFASRQAVIGGGAAMRAARGRARQGRAHRRAPARGRPGGSRGRWTGDRGQGRAGARRVDGSTWRASPTSRPIACPPTRAGARGHAVLRSDPRARSPPERRPPWSRSTRRRERSRSSATRASRIPGASSIRSSSRGRSGRDRPGDRRRPDRASRLRRRGPAPDRHADGVRAADGGRRSRRSISITSRCPRTTSPACAASAREARSVPRRCSPMRSPTPWRPFGVEVNELPLTPARLWTACAAAPPPGASLTRGTAVRVPSRSRDPMRRPRSGLVLVGLVVIALGETAGAVISQLRPQIAAYAQARVAANPQRHGLAGSAEYDAEVTARAVYAAEAGLSFFHTHAQGLGPLVILRGDGGGEPGAVAARPRRLMRCSGWARSSRWAIWPTRSRRSSGDATPASRRSSAMSSRRWAARRSWAWWRSRMFLVAAPRPGAGRVTGPRGDVWRRPPLRRAAGRRALDRLRRGRAAPRWCGSSSS